MIRYIFPVTFIVVVTLVSFRAQTDGRKGYGTVDTLTFYRVSTSATTDKNGTTYYIDDTPIDKATYDKYADAYENLKKCKPCWMKTYGRDGKLLYEGMQYTDCLVGDYRDYYSDGTLRSAGHYLENHTGKWKNIYERGYCGTKNGEWKYYSVSGKDSLTETYVKGKLVTTVK